MNVSNSFLACNACGQRSPFGLSERVHFLRRLGLLRRVKDPEPQIVAELFAARLPQLNCPHCGACQLRPAAADAGDDPEEDPEFWGERRRCAGCGIAIAAERLEVLPDAVRCAGCEAAADQPEAEVDYCERCGAVMNVVSSGRRTAQYRVRCPQCGPARRSFLAVGMLVSSVMLAGCGEADRSRSGDRATQSQASRMPVGPTFDELISRVVAGEATAIHTQRTLSDKALEHVNGLASLRRLRLDGGRITDAGIEHLTDLPNLVELRLRLSPITDASAPQIARLTNLQILNLPHSQWTSAAIRQLAGMASLRHLRLGSAKADEGLATAIAELDQLTSVHLIDIPLTDRDLQLLAAMPNLQSLYIDGAQLSDEAWSSVFENHPHLHVHVDQSHLDRDPNPHRH